MIYIYLYIHIYGYINPHRFPSLSMNSNWENSSSPQLAGAWCQMPQTSPSSHSQERSQHLHLVKESMGILDSWLKNQNHQAIYNTHIQHMEVS